MKEKNPKMPEVDPIILATTWHYIQRVCREMRRTVERTATNVLVVTLHDLAYGIWDADARVVAIPEGFPCRLISSSFPIKRIKEKFAGCIYPGDEFLTNYPPDGAVHLPDWVFIRPIFYKDELLFFTCMGTHVADSGGAHAGSHFLANDSIAEGLNIPVIRIAERGKLREDVLELILANNRLPDMMRREIASLMGSTVVAEKRMVELLDKYGKKTVLACIDEMIQRTEKAVRAEIAQWPEGSYYTEVKTDDDGANIGVPIAVRCRLTIKDGEASFDFSDADDQVKGMINSYYHQTLSNTLCATFLFLGKELCAYHNEGSLKSIHVKTRKGTIVDCNPGALVAGAPAITGNLVIEAVLTVLSQALPDKAITPYSRLIAPIITGIDPGTDNLYVYSSFCSAAGAGAVAGYDGYQCACETSTLGVVGKSDAEDEMMRFPWDIIRYEYRTDAHGAGKWRGAPGVIWEAVNEGGECHLIGGPWTGFHTQAPGQQGGGPTPLNKAYVLRKNQKIDITEPHLPMDLQAGDHLITLTGGGAGVGDPAERNPEVVRQDVRNELVSIEAAHDLYKVVIDPMTLEVDYSTTEALRHKSGM
jgi:N-methylhydantoinase B